MKVAYKYRIYPNKEQEINLLEMEYNYNLLQNIAVDIVKTKIVREQRESGKFNTAKDEYGKVIIDEETGEPKLFPVYKYPSKLDIQKLIYHLKDDEDCESWKYVTYKKTLDNKNEIKEKLKKLSANSISYIADAINTACKQKFNKKIAKRKVKKKNGEYKKPLLMTIDNIEEIDRTNLFYHKFNIFDCSYTVQVQRQSALKINENKKAHFNIPKIGLVKMIYHRPIPEGSKFDAVSISKLNNEWYITLGGLELPAKNMIDIENVNKIVGVDINTNNHIVTSDKEQFSDDNEKLKKIKKAIKRLQKRNGENKKDAITKTKRIYGSKNYLKNLLTIKKKYSKITRIKENNLHNVTAHLAKDYDMVVVEDLCVKGMQRFNGQMVQKNNFFEFRRQLDYKTEREGTQFKKVGRFYASTQTCSKCGKIHPEMKNMRKRVLKCDCGNIINRDYNAAINIKNEGIRLLEDDKIKS